MDDNWIKVIPAFLDYLQFEREQSVYKIHSYGKWLSYYSKRLPFPFSLQQIREFIVEIKKTHQPATTNYLITMTNSLMRWCQTEHNSQKDFSDYLNKMRPKNDTTPDANDLLSVEEVSLLIKNPVRKDADPVMKTYYERVDTMYSLFFELQYRIFARSGELLQLRKKDFNFSNHSLTFYKTKNGKDRTVGIPPQMEQRIIDYVEPMNFNDYIFIGHHSKTKYLPISQEMSNIAFKQRGKWCGIKRSLHIHQLRHSGASHMIANGCSIRTIQIIGGWARLSTVELYTHVLVEEQRRAMADYCPLNEKIDNKKLLYDLVKSKIEGLRLDKLGLNTTLSLSHHLIRLTITL